MEGMRQVTATNAGPLTGAGTNTYIIGTRDVAILDPGPDDPAHLAAILAALPAGATVSAILVSHAHRDHSALAGALARAVSAPVLAHGFRPAEALDGLGGGEGLDKSFRPDRLLSDGAVISGAGWRLEAVHTPGHLSDHLCFAWAARGAIFTGDHVMGWASTVVSPPDGDMEAYLASLDRLAARGERRYLPAHGDAIADGPARGAALRAHRLSREAAILDALAAGPADLATLTARVYRDTPPALYPAASRNLLAHLIKLGRAGSIASDGAPPLAAVFHRP